MKKPGWKTKKFWLGVIPVVAGALVSSGVFDDVPEVYRILSGIVAVLGAGGYAGKRAVDKVKARRAQ